MTSEFDNSANDKAEMKKSISPKTGVFYWWRCFENDKHIDKIIDNPVGTIKIKNTGEKTYSCSEEMKNIGQMIMEANSGNSENANELIQKVQSMCDKSRNDMRYCIFYENNMFSGTFWSLYLEILYHQELKK